MKGFIFTLLLSSVLLSHVDVKADEWFGEESSYTREIGRETVVFIGEEARNILGYTELIEKALRSPECLIKEEDRGPVKTPLCLINLGGDLVSITVERTGQIGVDALVYAERVTDEISDLVSHLLERTGSRLEEGGLSPIGQSFIIASGLVKTANTPKRHALKTIRWSVHFVSGGVIKTIHF